MTIGKINISQTLAQGEKALLEDQSLSPQIRNLIQILLLVIKLLLDKFGLDSSNSSIPPSQDPNRKKGSKKKTEGEPRKPGGQLNHKGSTLVQEKNPDEIIVIPLDRLTLPEGVYEDGGFEARQVIEVEISKKVIEYRAETVRNQKGEKFIADFPAEVTRPIQYGNSVKSQAVYMSQQQLLPYDRIRDYFSDQCGITLSAGSLFNFNKQAFTLLEKFEAITKEQLIAESLLHADETGINVNGKTTWLHSASSELWTMYFPHEKRGREATQAMGVLEHFRGILVHDHWKPYFTYPCQHALCNAHHLRELERACEQDGQQWAKNMGDLLREINTATQTAGGKLPKPQAQIFRLRYQNILAQGDLECPEVKAPAGSKKRGKIAQGKSRNLLERLRDYQKETLRFMYETIVPFTNNPAENILRMTKVQQKISGCFRSMEGAKIFCRVRGYLSTCEKHGISPTQALRDLFAGKMPEFVPKKE